MNADLFNLAGKVALITGATRGIGLAIARAYGRAGARLAISSESLEDCTRVAATLASTEIAAFAKAGSPMCRTSARPSVSASISIRSNV